MKLRKPAYVHAVVVAALSFALAAATPALAQGRGGGGPPGGGGPGGPGGGMGGPGGPPGGGMGGQFPGGGPGPMSPSGRGNVPPQQGQGPRNQAGGNLPPRPGIQLGPPERWWDDKAMVKDLKLRPDQQARMDAIFDQNRSTLVARLQSVRQAEAQLDQMSNAPAPDEAALFAQIDRVAQARVELEKATTRMLLQIRKEMDPDQIKRLEKLTPR